MWLINKINDRKSLTKTESAYLLGYMDGMEACFQNPARGEPITRMGQIGVPAEFDTAPCRGAIKRGFQQAQIDFNYLNAQIAKHKGDSQ